MSILEAVLDGIAQGLGVESSDVEALTKLLHPNEFESRKDEATALEVAIGYDPETYWNRKEMLETLRDMAGVSVDDDSKDPPSNVIDEALDQFNKMRDSFFDYVFQDVTHPGEPHFLFNDTVTAKEWDEARDLHIATKSPIMQKIDAMLQPGDEYTIRQEDVAGKSDQDIFEFVKEQILNNRAEKAVAEDGEDFDDYADEDVGDDEDEPSLREEAQEIDEAEFGDDDIEYPEEIDDLEDEEED